MSMPDLVFAVVLPIFTSLIASLLLRPVRTVIRNLCKGIWSHLYLTTRFRKFCRIVDKGVDRFNCTLDKHYVVFVARPGESSFTLTLVNRTTRDNVADSEVDVLVGRKGKLELRFHGRDLTQHGFVFALPLRGRNWRKHSKMREICIEFLEEYYLACITGGK